MPPISFEGFGSPRKLSFIYGHDEPGILTFPFSMTSSLGNGVVVKGTWYEKVAADVVHSSAPASSIAASCPSLWYAVVRVTEDILVALFSAEAHQADLLEAVCLIRAVGHGSLFVFLARGTDSGWRSAHERSGTDRGWRRVCGRGGTHRGLWRGFERWNRRAERVQLWCAVFPCSLFFTASTSTFYFWFALTGAVQEKT